MSIAFHCIFCERALGVTCVESSFAARKEEELIEQGTHCEEVVLGNVAFNRADPITLFFFFFFFCVPCIFIHGICPIFVYSQRGGKAVYR